MRKTSILTCTLLWLAVTAPGVAMAQEPPVQEPAAPEPAAQEPAVQEPAERWGAEVGMSLNSSAGNERLTVLTSELGLTHLETTAYELSFRGRLRYGRSEGTEVARNVRVTLNADFWPGERWSPFVFGTGEHDPFRRLDVRLNSGAGIKRTFWRDGWSEVSLSGAVLYEYESLMVPDTVDSAGTHAARWSWRGRGRHHVREGIRLEQVVFYQPAWDRPADYQLESHTRARVAVTERLSITASLLYQRDSTPPPDVVADDWAIAIGLSLATAW
jgi:hypothetical protein